MRIFTGRIKINYNKLYVMVSETSTVNIVTYVKNVRNCHCYVGHIGPLICIIDAKFDKYLSYVGIYFQTNYYRHI